jgi:hypothetical protein
MSEPATNDSTPIESPPPAPNPPREASATDPRIALHKLASELMRTHNRKLLVEFLQLRRALR